MARIEWVEQRLQRWATAVTVGDGAGYPAMSVIHPNWMPPAKGSVPSMKVAHGRDDAAATHRSIGLLSAKQRDAVCLKYVYRLTDTQHAVRADCAERTVRLRLEAAHAALAAMWQPGSFCNMPESG